MAVQLPLAGLLPAHPLPALSDDACDASLWDYPDCPTEILLRHAKLTGAAGEALFDSMMLRLGLLPLEIPEANGADRLLIVGNVGLKVQVKATTHSQDGVYRFSASKGYNRGHIGVRAYEAGEFDLLALAVLPENVIAFTTSKRTYQGIPTTAIPALRLRPRDTLEEALRDLGVPIPGETPGAGLHPVAAGAAEARA
ncbi:hypothetical protein DKT77_17690 [Meridianimarinicoccus roseus]|uniref:PD(D/E)XK endonuclease domain-containing protein n=1 Tax=Meridianimarinicoccus roseus TaxID=2072018 RepID=A0A2V2LC38_9RHOB|nr:hypothetical protein [Meridianimarinicoccus roseus]PWR01301.1 hypothetical protein DKT77_17690 [Meridianimarinicoccus roseus]